PDQPCGRGDALGSDEVEGAILVPRSPPSPVLAQFVDARELRRRDLRRGGPGSGHRFGSLSPAGLPAARGAKLPASNRRTPASAGASAILTLSPAEKCRLPTGR